MRPGGKGDEVGVAIGYGVFAVVFDGEQLEIARDLKGLMDGAEGAVFFVSGASPTLAGISVAEVLGGFIASFVVFGVFHALTMLGFSCSRCAFWQAGKVDL